MRLSLDLGHRLLLFASTTNIELGPRFADISPTVFLRNWRHSNYFCLNFQKQSLVGGLAAVAMLGGLIGAGNIQGVVRFVQVSSNSIQRDHLHIR